MAHSLSQLCVFCTSRPTEDLQSNNCDLNPDLRSFITPLGERDPSPLSLSHPSFPYFIMSTSFPKMGCDTSKFKGPPQSASGRQVKELTRVLANHRDQQQPPAPPSLPHPRKPACHHPRDGKRGPVAPSSKLCSQSSAFQQLAALAHQQQQTITSISTKGPTEARTQAHYFPLHERQPKRKVQAGPSPRDAGPSSFSGQNPGDSLSSHHVDGCHCKLCNPTFYTDGRLKIERLNHHLLGCRCHLCIQRRATHHNIMETSG